jgi:tetratricopeptide (TPR) repeat protein
LDKELKKQIKEDEFVSSVEHLLAWFREHRDEARITAAVLAVVAAVLGAAFYFQGARQREAERGFAEALQTFDAPVASPEGEAPGGKTFPTPKEKYSEAAVSFDGLARKFPTTAEGRRARYFAAICRLEIGQYKEAEHTLGELSAEREAGMLEPALARLALADLYRRTGQTDKAVDLYKQFAADPSATMPRDFALMSLASTLESAQKLAEARASYRRIYEEFPGSVYAPEARRRADRLDSAVEG